jgi:hypothetical protein
MGIFDTLKNAILGSHLHAGSVPSTGQPQTGTAAAPKPGASAQPQQTPTAQAPSATAQAPSAPATGAPVDIGAVLSAKAAQKHEKLNWQSSIVDLMKVVDLDPSLDNRKTLAKELGYTGDTQDSANMNIWLHKEVMQRLATSGGTVPDSLRH